MTETFTPGTNPPLLDYALEVHPDPLVAGGRAVLVLVASYSGDDVVACQSIQLTLPVGTDASDLIDGEASVSTEPQSSWTANVEGGVVNFTAPGGSATIDKHGVIFRIATVANGESGTAWVALTEWASDEGGASQQGGGAFEVPKFPADFSLSSLAPVPPDKVDYPCGQAAMLTWVASGSGVSCTLEYQPADSGPLVSVQVPNDPDPAGFQTQPLTRSLSVTFTLIASVTVLGQDNPLTTNRQCTVTVESMSITMTALPPRVGAYGLVLLQWDAPNADHCLFQDGTVLAASGSSYFVVAQTQTLTITAVDAGGGKKEGQQTVTVDPAIVPTESGFSATGTRGDDGVPGYYDPDRYQVPGAGGNGTDASLTVSLPPLDTSGLAQRVIPVTVAGGDGGNGGVMASGWPMPSGSGGNGGNASLVATIDSTQSPPAQFIIRVTAGAGGLGGDVTPCGVNGQAGSATATLDGQVLALP